MSIMKWLFVAIILCIAAVLDLKFKGAFYKILPIKIKESINKIFK